MSLFDKFVEGLKKTRESFSEKFEGLFRRGLLDEEFFEGLEEILITSDMGVELSLEVVEELKSHVKAEKVAERGEIKSFLRRLLVQRLGGEGEGAKEDAGEGVGEKAEEVEREDAKTRAGEGAEAKEGAETRAGEGIINFAPQPPTVVLILGVNGVGKTTSIGKLAYLLKGQGKKSVFAAGDTFRAAAGEQLEIWAQRAGAEIVAHQQGSDPGSVIFDAISAARSRGTDVVLCDTAGRFHTKYNLMEELKKLVRVAGKACSGAPHETLLVIDATTGQNAMAQAELFSKSVEITGLILTKLDGTARGGIALTVRDRLKIPIKFIGLGEGLDDLQPFSAEEFVDALLDV